MKKGIKKPQVEYLVDRIVEELNLHMELRGENKRYKVLIERLGKIKGKNGQEVEGMELQMQVLEGGSGLIVHSLVYQIDNVIDRLDVNKWKRKLYETFLYESIGTFFITAEPLAKKCILERNKEKAELEAVKSVE